MLGNDFADSKIPVKRVALLDELTKNRTKHTADYAEAYEGYKTAFVKDAQKLLAQAMDGNFEKTTINCAPPQDHTKDYDRVIRMMEMCTTEEVIITEQQFSQYVLDEWGWQRDFAASKMRYTGQR